MRNYSYFMLLFIYWYIFQVFSAVIISYYLIMQKKQLIAFFIAILVVAIHTQGSQTSSNQNQVRIYLISDSVVQIQSGKFNLSGKSLYTLRQELKERLGNDDFKFLRAIQQEEQKQILASDVLHGQTILAMKHQPEQISQNLRGLVPSGSNVIILDQNNQQQIKQPQDTPVAEQKEIEFQRKENSQGVYIGQLVNGIRSGQGQYCFKTSGDCYEGSWANDKWNGQGTYKFSDGSSISGKWLNGQLFGQAVIEYAGGNRYQGPVRNLNPNGKGVLQTETYVYTGDFKDGSLTGRGQFVFISGPQQGNVYNGQVINGIIYGQGKLIYGDGNSYQGQWINNKRSGKGIQRQGDQILYEGEWLNGRFNGQGTYYDLQQNLIIKGTFLNGQLNGKATIILQDGTIQQKFYRRGVPV